MKTNYNLNIKTDALIELAQTLCHQNNFDEILRLITQKAANLLDAEIALIMMINPRTHQTLKTVFSEGKKTDERPYHLLHTSISGWVQKNRASLISKDIKSDLRFRQSVFKNIAVKSVLCTPLFCEDHIIGMLMLFNKEEKLHSYVGTYINGEDAFPNELSRTIKDGDEIHVIYIIGGG